MEKESIGQKILVGFATTSFILFFFAPMMYNMYCDSKKPPSEHWFIERRMGFDIECASKQEALELAGGHRVYMNRY